MTKKREKLEVNIPKQRESSYMDSLRLLDITIYLLQKYNMLHLLKPNFSENEEEFNKISKAYQDITVYLFHAMGEIMQFSFKHGYEISSKTKNIIIMAEELIKQDEKEFVKLFHTDQKVN